MGRDHLLFFFLTGEHIEELFFLFVFVFVFLSVVQTQSKHLLHKRAKTIFQNLLLKKKNLTASQNSVFSFVGKHLIFFFLFCSGFILPVGFPGGSNIKESTFNAGDLGLIPGLGRSPGEGNS